MNSPDGKSSSAGKPNPAGKSGDDVDEFVERITAAGRVHLRTARLVSGPLFCLFGVVSIGGVLLQLEHPQRVAASILVGLASLLIGVMLLRPFTSWKIAGPVAIVLVVAAVLAAPKASDRSDERSSDGKSAGAPSVSGVRTG